MVEGVSKALVDSQNLLKIFMREDYYICRSFSKLRFDYRVFGKWVV